MKINNFTYYFIGVHSATISWSPLASVFGDNESQI